MPLGVEGGGGRAGSRANLSKVGVGRGLSWGASWGLRPVWWGVRRAPGGCLLGSDPGLPPCMGALLQGTLFPMCGMNLAFDREAIGPAMYFGLMGEGQPWGRYDGEWAAPVLAGCAGAARHRPVCDANNATWLPMAFLPPGAAIPVCNACKPTRLHT